MKISLKGGEKLQKEVKLENSSEIKDFSEYAENKLAIAKICVLSTAENSHHLEISEEVLRRDIGSIRGNFLVADMMLGDATTHTDSEVPVGYFLPNEEIEFEEVETNKGKIVKAWAYAVLSKQYARAAYEMFIKDNHRATSIEMNVILDEEDENKVLSFDAFGSTILGKAVAPSCKDAEISLIRFAEEAQSFFKENAWLSPLEQFAESRKRLMAETKSYKIDKSKEAMSTSDWSNVDKTALRNKIIEAKNASTLVKSVYLKIDTDWSEAPSERLHYPVMQFDGDTLVYNRNALSNALARAVQNDETAVVNKIKKIYKNLGLDQDGKEDAKMSEVVFEDKQEVKEEMAEAKEEMECKKMEEQECETEDGKDDDDSNEEVEMSADEMKAEMARLQSEIENRDNIIMEKDTKMGEMEAELSELREYKAACEKKELATSVESLMSEVKECMAEDDYKRFRDEGLTCKMSELDAWSNKVKAFCFENGKVGKGTKKNDGIFSFAAPVETTVKKNSLWD